MLDQTLTLPEDPEVLRNFTARLLAEVQAQAILIGKLRHLLAGHRDTSLGPHQRPLNSCNWRWRPARLLRRR